MRKAIKINGDESEILSVSLNDILNCIYDIKDINWGVLWIEASANLDGEDSIPDFEQKVNKSENGVTMEWEELLKLSTQIIQAIDIIIIGDKNELSIKRYSTDEEMYNSCQYTIELIDSSYWIIHSKNNAFLESIFEKLKGVEFLEL